MGSHGGPTMNRHRVETATVRRGLVLAIALMAVAGFSAATVVSFAGADFGVAAAAGTSAAVPVAAATSTASSSGAEPSPTNFAEGNALSNDHHQGTLIVDEGGGPVATSIDPAVDYDTIGAEPEENVYETLIQYDNATTGITPSSFIPVVATCVPGSAQCVSDYGSTLTVNFGSGPYADIPQYYTFVIDPAAHFYDPVSGKSWKVYPTDVMFSVARTIAWSSGETSGYTPGWILGQSLLPSGNASWDGGLHFPYNNTGYGVLGSMLVNDSAYCPTKAMNGITGDGCITFDVNGQGQAWPGFLEFIEDSLGGAIMSCGWTNSIQAADGTPEPGFSSTSNDSSCLLPDGYNSTSGAIDGPAWTAYLAEEASNSPSVVNNATSWDNFDELILPAEFDATYNPTPPIQDDAVGSGPYYLAGPPLGTMSLTGGYTLAASPGYVQPSACSGAIHGITSYASGGFCYPAADTQTVHHYIPNVDVTYYVDSQSEDTAALGAFESGDVDFAPFLPSDFPTDVLPNTQYISIDQFPSISTFFISYSLSYSAVACGTFTGGSCSEGGNAVPATFATNVGVRDLLTAAFPYSTLFSQGEDKEGPVTFDYCAGGPIPAGMTPWYPTNVTYPCAVNGGVPDTSPLVQGSEGWWWEQLSTPGSGWNDADIDACVNETGSGGCVFPLFGEAGNSILNDILPDWAANLYAISGHALNPFPYDTETFGALVGAETSSSGGDNPAMIGNLGWAPDYPLPSDYENPMVNPQGIYTNPDYVSQELDASESPQNAAICGYTDPSNYSDLVYWANNPYAINTTCQGYAYDTAVYWDEGAAKLPAGALSQALLEYNLAGHIFNTLDLYAWQGNANEVFTFAPWINPASIDANPTFGGGGDTLWMYIKYQSTQEVNFKETGLPTGTVWQVSTTNAGVTTSGNAEEGYNVLGSPNAGSGQVVTLNLTVGKDVVVPSILVQGAGPTYEAFASASTTISPLSVAIAATAPTITLTFTAVGNATLTEYGIGPTAFAAPSFCGTITSGAATKGPPTYSACATPTSPSIPVTLEVTNATGSDMTPSGATAYKYTATVPTGFAICTKVTAACPIVGTLKAASGTFGIVSAGTTTAETIYFYPVYETVKFSISGLPAYTTWSVTVSTFSGPTVYTATLLDTTAKNGAGSISFSIQQNKSAVYEYTVNTYTLQTGYVPSITSGYFSPSAAKTISITAMDPKSHVVILYGPEALSRLLASER